MTYNVKEIKLQKEKQKHNYLALDALTPISRLNLQTYRFFVKMIDISVNKFL